MVVYDLWIYRLSASLIPSLTLEPLLTGMIGFAPNSSATALLGRVVLDVVLEAQLCVDADVEGVGSPLVGSLGGEGVRRNLGVERCRVVLYDA